MMIKLKLSSNNKKNKFSREKCAYICNAIVSNTHTQTCNFFAKERRNEMSAKRKFNMRMMLRNKRKTKQNWNNCASNIVHINIFLSSFAFVLKYTHTHRIILALLF